ALNTDAQLTLESPGGQAALWRLLVPAKAAVTPLAAADEARVAKIDSTAVKGATARLVTVRLKEPSDAPLKLQVKVQAPMPLPGTRVSIGPFTVLGATKQSGTLLVSNAAADLHLDYHPQGDLA